MLSHFCRVVCSVIGPRVSRVCIAFVLGIIVTTPDVHDFGMVPALRNRCTESFICGSKISENLFKNFAEKPSSSRPLLLFNLLRPSCTMSAETCLNSSRPALRSRYSTHDAYCYNVKMIRRCVLTRGQFQSLEDVRLLNALLGTWKGVYNHGGRLVSEIPLVGGCDTPTVHVQNRTRAWLLQFYASQTRPRDPQTP